MDEMHMNMKHVVAHDVVPHYQRIHQLQKEGEVGLVFEALARLNMNGAVLEPRQFMGFLSSPHELAELDMRITTCAIKQMAKWRQASCVPISMHVNASGASLTDPAYAEKVKHVLDRCHVEPSRLTVEISEGYTFWRTKESLRTIELLSEMGVGLAIDDFPMMEDPFGTLAWINQHRGLVRTLKFDREFVQAACDKADGSHFMRLLRYTITAHELGMDVIAEGIERPDQLDLMRLIEVDGAQGFFDGKPQPPHKINLAVLGGERIPQCVLS